IGTRDAAASRRLAPSPAPHAGGGHLADRLCRGRGRVHGQVQARAGARGPRGHAVAARRARAGRGAGRGRADHRRGAGQVRRRPGPAGMKGWLAVTLILFAAAPATGHHVGAYVPRDNEVSANFKQLKFSIQARKFDVAARLFETGAIRVEMRARAGRIPGGLEEATRAALVAGDGPRAERGLMVFFAALIRDLALEADQRLADPREPARARVATGQKLLEAIW